MWSHYADNHRGVCIEFDSESDVFMFASPVRYTEELPVIVRPDDSSEEMLNKAFFTKAKCWEYEQEWRVFKRNLSVDEKRQTAKECHQFSEEGQRILVDQSGPGVYTFSKDAIRSVTLGLQATSQQQEQLLVWIQEAGLRIHVYKAEATSAQYRLTRRILRRV